MMAHIPTPSVANVIGFYNFSAATRSTIPTTADFADALSDVNAGNIVFTRVVISTGVLRIFKYAIASGALTEIAPEALPLRSNPRSEFGALVIFVKIWPHPSMWTHGFICSETLPRS